MSLTSKRARTELPKPDAPLRGELLGADRLAAVARMLADSQSCLPRAPKGPLPIVPLLESAERDLGLVYRTLAADVRRDVPVAPAAEWLLDNFYLIDEQFRTLKAELTAEFGRRLPCLVSGEFAGFPRVVEAMAVLAKHTDTRIDREHLELFVMAFQDVSPLTVAEVWALPVALRLVVLENLRRLSRQVLRVHEAIVAADRLADRALAQAPSDASAADALVAELERDYADAPAAFLVRLSQRLAGQEVVLAPLADWLDATLAARGETLDQVRLSVHQGQAADQVSVANAITTLRHVTGLAWREFFEHVSVVERALRDDPADVYARMDFASRDRYRHAIEGLAERSGASELEVSVAAVDAARRALAEDPSDARRGHVGHYLISDGRYAFERTLGYRPTLRERVYRGPLSHRGLVYWGVLAAVTAAVVAAVVLFAWRQGAPPPALVLLALLALVPASDVGVTVINRLAAWWWPPRVLPKLDHRLPVAAAHRTLVVYTALLTSVEAAEHVVDNLEVGYLANADPNVSFAVLADLKAAPAKTVPADDAVIEAARAGVARLNERYGTGGERPFWLFVRGRSWAARDRVWMGWERKRGALTELCRLLRGATDTSFVVADADAARLATVTFLVTLDTDTVLPRDGARRLVSTIAHPLNRAELDPKSRTVRQGYGLVQPRVGVSLEGSTDSLFAWLFSGPTGIDPYAGAVSDTYQDVFGEGSFTGKGIFEVDVFNAAVGERFPENTLLSHDLLEGSYLRTALASDVEVLDDQPSSYISHCARLHRWVRGDWQTLPWLFPRVPTPKGTEPNPLTLLARWKIVDNLRRSLLAPSTVALAVAGFALVPHGLWAWLAIVVGVVLFPTLVSVANTLAANARRSEARGEWSVLLADLRRDLLRGAFLLAVLAHQATLMVDAIARALWRMTVSRRNLLEWETAAEAERRLGSTAAAAFWRRMWPGEAVALASAAATLGSPAGLAALGASSPLLAVWLGAPALAWRASRPIVPERPELSEADLLAMRRIARKTWRFFETFVTAEDHYLAPDNFQEDPKGEVAHRTSPTNIGLQLLSYVTAYDLGYAGVAELVERVSATLHTMAGMERFRGHFYNWYDTQTLQPLRPGYVSTVDSGNLAGHLLALRMALLEIADRPLVAAETLDGVADTARLALEDLQRTRSDAPEARELRATLEEVVRRARLDEPPATLAEWRTTLAGLASVASALDAPAASLATAGGPGSPLAAAAASARAVDEGIRRLVELIDTLAPWAERLARVPAEAPLDALAPIATRVPSLAELAEGLGGVADALAEAASASEGPAAAWCAECARLLGQGAEAAARLLAELRLDCDIAWEMWEHTDFAMLFDSERMVFSIGFNTAEGRLDDSYYDMLASECRLASFLAIAKGDVPQEHWFRLGRAITQTEGGKALVSWSASMFEYLMPLLVMKSWPDTLLDRTYRAVVRRQIQYGRQRGVPWGVSESAFNALDVELTYQYQAFGVPGLGLKRGLSADVVIAPYATMLALMVEPRAALDNLAELARQGAEGPYGFYEAVDYTPGRVPAGKERAIVRAYMAHHQGMGLVALGNVLTGFRMQERFHAEPVVASAELLLQERVPRRIELAKPRVEEVEFVRSLRELPPPVTRAYPLADTPTPATHFLSNGTYSVMVTNAGGGYSRWKDRTVTRYREDITRDCWGSFFYLKDTDDGHVWSAAMQPALTPADDYHVTFSADKADFRRLDRDIETHTEVFVSPEDDAEVRRISITNRRAEPAHLEVTSYLEVTLAPHGQDHAHKAYSNLFVETEAVEEYHALLFTRRPRSAEEPRYWGAHVLACEAPVPCAWSYETDRAAFLGRLRTPANAQAIWGDGRLTGTTGPVLDPICAIRLPVTVEPGQTVRLAFTTAAADSRERILSLAEKYHDVRSAQRAADLAWSTSQIELRDLGITPEEAVVFQRLASRLLLTDPHSRLKVTPPVENRLPLSALWQIGISGDYPILLLKIERAEETPLVRQALLAHQYWRSKGFVADLVILNTKGSTYASELDGKLRMLIRTGHALQLADRPGGVHLRTADHIQPEVLTLLESVARAVIRGDAGPIALQLNLRARHPELPDPFVPSKEPEAFPPVELERPALVFDNGYGGLDPATNEYVIFLEDDRVTPAPWVNVMASPRFGTLVSEAGIGCTWAENSHENRITTWNNDPVSDGTGECLYVRDEETGEFWSPTLLPVRSDGPYLVRHGLGYSRFEHASHGLAHELDWFVAEHEPVRFARLRLTNKGDRARRLSVTHFIEWTLGDSRSAAQQRVVTWWDDGAKALMAHNWFNLDFPGRPAFVACDQEVDSYTASRTEFLGRNGVPTAPAAMRRRHLGRQTGRFHDNCGALQRVVELAPGETAEVVFLLGQAETVEGAHELIHRFREPGAVEAEFARVKRAWRRTVGAVTVETPDASLDAMLNGWVPYQSLACRFWGRTATYQSSGAFGFRDQLQDCLALLDSRPDLVRDHIVEASRHQFPEGDVLHWWQPVSGRGVRTRYSDDRHWLPFIVAEYVRATGDLAVLDVETPYLEGPPVPDDREDLYLQPHPSLAVASVYEHCLAALDLAPLGQHGLPLIGGGDWNDGMNRVGVGGRGESVWLAWFLDVTMRSFAEVCDARGDHERAGDLRARAARLVAAAEAAGWDGAWYRRAYFDDGTPLGSAASDECRIDAIAQAWSVISGQGDPERASQALEAVHDHLVSEEHRLLKLLTPPFDRTPHDPGYIKGYVPGVRENGGQYTHAAVWVVLAHALLGEGDRAAWLLGMLNPLNHALDAPAAERYKVEPYVVAADVYACEPHAGRGGWTWYTGSAAWFYHVALRFVLGVRVRARDGARFLELDPCIPASWPGFRATYRFGTATYRIEVRNPHGASRGVASVTLDGEELTEPLVPLADDGGAHAVVVELGRSHED